VLQCGVAIAVRLRRRRGQAHISGTASASSSLKIEDETQSCCNEKSLATQSLYLDEFTTTGTTDKKLLKGKGASPSVISFMYHADNAFDSLQGRHAKHNPAGKIAANSEEIYNTSVLTVHPSLQHPGGKDQPPVQMLSSPGLATQEEAEGTARELLVEYSNYGGTDPLSQKGGESLIIGDGSLRSQYNIVTNQQRASLSLFFSGGLLHMGEDSLVYADFPSSFLSCGGEFANDHSFASVEASS